MYTGETNISLMQQNLVDEKTYFNENNNQGFE